MDAEIKDAVNMELAKKGLTKATGDTADLLVSYQTAVDKQKAVERVRDRWHWLGLRRHGHSDAIDDRGRDGQSRLL